MRIRTIPKAVEYIREIDPKSDFTETALRRLVKSGEIPSRRAGRKYLISLDVLEAFLTTGMQVPENPAQSGVIRAIKP